MYNKYLKYKKKYYDLHLKIQTGSGIGPSGPLVEDENEGGEIYRTPRPSPSSSPSSSRASVPVSPSNTTQELDVFDQIRQSEGTYQPAPMPSAPPASNRRPSFQPVPPISPIPPIPPIQPVQSNQISSSQPVQSTPIPSAPPASNRRPSSQPAQPAPNQRQSSQPAQPAPRSSYQPAPRILYNEIDDDYVVAIQYIPREQLLNGININKPTPRNYITIANGGIVTENDILSTSQCFWLSIRDYFNYARNQTYTIRQLKTWAGLNISETMYDMVDIHRIYRNINRLCNILNIRIRIYPCKRNNNDMVPNLDRTSTINGNIPIPIFISNNDSNTSLDVINIANTTEHFELIIDGPYLPKLVKHSNSTSSFIIGNMTNKISLRSRGGEEVDVDDRTLTPNQKQAICGRLLINHNLISIQQLTNTIHKLEESIRSNIEAINELINGSGLYDEEINTLMNEWLSNNDINREQIKKARLQALILINENDILDILVEKLDR
jgi:hypothetical protein